MKTETLLQPHRIRRIIKKYYEKFSAHKLDNLDERAIPSKKQSTKIYSRRK